MFCEKCGSAIEDGSAFCPNCGEKFEDIPLSANENPNPTPTQYNEPPQHRKSALGVVAGFVVAIAVVVCIVFAAVHFLGGGAIKKSDNPSLAIAKQMYKDMNTEAKKLKRKNGSYPDSDDLVEAMKKYDYSGYGYEAFVAVNDYDDGEIETIIVVGAEDVEKAMDDVKSAAVRGNLNRVEDYIKGYKTDSWEELDLDDLQDELEDMADDIDDAEDALEAFPVVYCYASGWIDLPGLLGDVANYIF